jgi:hypothetical protein
MTCSYYQLVMVMAWMVITMAGTFVAGSVGYRKVLHHAGGGHLAPRGDPLKGWPEAMAYLTVVGIVGAVVMLAPYWLGVCT